ncbi:putative membrane-anchored protein [Priestia taiwanensis]|uniref:Uncharacterized protein n=2 Tax=Priestia taiwanensis TaxID=1347902 RepID=A0A917ARY5_9BACI|nr:putative membrane-anchored protein [Priestia taiwanensis]GGE69889.1 hypothetical protein GCM10007140_19850 [Priestia taiwanensis]
MDVLDHLLEAQKNGKTAFNVVGKEPKKYCDELIEALPKPTFWQRVNDSLFVYMFMLSFILIVDTIVSFFLNQAETNAQTFIVNPLGILLIILLASIMLFLSPKHSRKTAVMKKRLGSQLFNGALFVLYWILGTATTKGYLALKKSGSTNYRYTNLVGNRSRHYIWYLI